MSISTFFVFLLLSPSASLFFVRRTSPRLWEVKQNPIMYALSEYTTRLVRSALTRGTTVGRRVDAASVRNTWDPCHPHASASGETNSPDPSSDPGPAPRRRTPSRHRSGSRTPCTVYMLGSQELWCPLLSVGQAKPNQPRCTSSDALASEKDLWLLSNDSLCLSVS